MAELSAKQREHLKDGAFAYIDEEGGRHLPIHDEEHIRNAVARFGQTHFESTAARRQAARKVLKTAKEHGIEVSREDDVAKAAR